MLRSPDFQRVKRKGGSWRSEHFVVVVRRAPEHPEGRLGIIASRKCGNAVQRNRGKRVVREWFRHASVGPLDVVVILRRGAHLLSAGEAGAQLEEALAGARRKADRSRAHRSSKR